MPNKELYLRRDSFSDRFCDDLCSVIVSYLSFEDKIQFECVSHQFQRCVFVSQYVIEKYIISQLTLINGNIRLKAFESVLKKCKFINKIVIRSERIGCENREQVLQLITKYCKHLKSIEFIFEYIDYKVLVDFGQKCGKTLQNIAFFPVYSEFNYNGLLKLCPNIRSLTNIRLEDIIEDNELVVPKLVSVKTLHNITRINLFETFVQKTKNSLKSLQNTTLHKIYDELIKPF